MTVSARAYARHRGVSHTAVLKALQTKRITRAPDGKIDPEIADQEWNENTDTSKPRNSVSGRPRGRRQPGNLPTPMGEVETPIPASSGSRAAGTYANASALRMSYQAKLAKLEFEREEGRLIDAEQMRAAIFQAGTELRRKLNDLANQLAPELAPLAVPLTIQQVLAVAFERILADLARDFQQLAEDPSAGRKE